MSLIAAMMCCASSAKTYVEDVFSTYLYTGNGSTQTIVNGIDLAGKGGMVWTKSRAGTYGEYNHSLFDTTRGLSILHTDQTGAQASVEDAVTSFNSNGFSLGADTAWMCNNVSSTTYASWTFRKAPKFFDIVTYTGNGVAGRQIPHGLGVAPGFITTKSTSTTGNWNSYHRSATGDLVLNSTDAQTGSRAIVTAADSSTFTVSGVANTNGAQYVAYLFAHDTSADGLIKCGSFTTDWSGNATVNLGWEPQYVLWKNSTDAGENWYVTDNMRGMSMTRYGISVPNTSDAEYSGDLEVVQPTATGITFKDHSASSTWVYIAIRRPNKPPTSGTQVYNAIAYSGNDVTPRNITGSGFVVDAVITSNRSSQCNHSVADRLRVGGSDATMQTNSIFAEGTNQWGAVSSFSLMDGVSVVTGSIGYDNVNDSASTYINHFFRRAPCVMDVVCYTGTSIAHTVAHSLQAAPEMVVVKSSSDEYNWWVWHKNIATTEVLKLNENDAKIAVASAFSSGGTVTDTVFPVGTYSETNNSGVKFVAYLWATCSGVSKVGSYTGNGASQTIPCGFTTGARFILVKRTDAAGDWYVWDTARGIVAANDPHLSLNTTAAEVTTDDSIDPYSAGFTVNQNAATNINVSAATYIFLAIS